MACTRFTWPDGTQGLVCGPKVRLKPCPCGNRATLLCDYPVRRGKTCDAPLCAGCTTKRGGGDLCPAHAEGYRTREPEPFAATW